MYLFVIICVAHLEFIRVFGIVTGCVTAHVSHIQWETFTLGSHLGLDMLYML